MKRSISHQLLIVLVTIGTLSALAGLSIGFWCLVQDSTTASFALRGLIALASVLLVSAIVALLLARRLTKPLASTAAMVNEIRSGKVPRIPEAQAPVEISKLSNSLYELAEKLDRDRESSQARWKEQSREVRTEALLRLSRGIAREVQSPLAGIIGFTEMALKQPGISGQLNNYLTLIDQEARLGRQSLDRVLRYTQNDDFPSEPMDLNRLLIESSRSIDSPAGENIRLKINLADGLPKVMGAPGQISQVLDILIQNAKEAVGKDGDIEMNSTSDSSGNVVIIIKDSGVGIPEDLQDKVFTPFFTTKGNIRGAGLNLAVADSIARSHGGKLEFFSKEGEGTTFFLKLPAAE